MKNKYKITIEKVVTETQKTKEYVRILSDKAYELQMQKGGDKPIQYDYVETEREVEVEETIFKQIVEDLDLVSIINAINKEVEDK